jgi:hypothetical protein
MSCEPLFDTLHLCDARRQVTVEAAGNQGYTTHTRSLILTSPDDQSLGNGAGSLRSSKSALQAARCSASFLLRPQAA